jgi:cell division protein FtsL
MKSLKLLVIFFVILLSVGAIHAKSYAEITNFQSAIKAKNLENNQNNQRIKDGRYKRKKGFMWGLFKKKSACDCPKH